MLGWLFRKNDQWDDYYRDEPQGGRGSRRPRHPRLLIHFIVLFVISTGHNIRFIALFVISASHDFTGNVLHSTDT